MIKNYRQLVSRYMISNKKTTLAMVITILISVMLLVSVGMIINIYNNGRIEMVAVMYGKYIAGFRGVEDDLVDKLGKFDGITKVGTTMITGDLQIDDSKMQIRGADTEAYNLLSAKPIKGRLPEKDDEIAIEEGIYSKMKDKPELGEKFKLNYSYTDTNGGQVIPKQNEFILCGILENVTDTETPDTGKAYITLSAAISQTTKYHRLFQQWFTIDNNLPVDETLMKINQYATSKSNPNDNIINGYLPNLQYIEALKTAQGAKSATTFFDILVALAVVMVIFNVFSISVLQRKKHYGLLRALGITQKQIRGMMFIEAFLFAVIVVPIGIILGIFATFVILNIIGGTAFQSSILNVITPYNILFPAIINILSIIAAVYSPAKLASKVSPIESLTQENVKIDKKVHSIDKLSRTGRFIGYTGRMAFTNVKRYKKRFIATVLAIGVGIALFVFSTYIIDSLNPMYQLDSQIGSDFDLRLSSTSLTNSGYSEEIAEEIQNIPGVKSINKLQFAGMDYVLDSRLVTPEYIKIKDNGASGHQTWGQGYHVRTQVFGCSEEFIQSLREQVSDKDNNAELFIVQNLYKNYTQIKNGDKVELFFNYIKEDGKYQYIDKDAKVDYVLDDLPIKLYNMESYIATFVPYKFLEDNFNVTGYQDIQIDVYNDADFNMIEGRLLSIANKEKNGQLVSYKNELEKWRNVQIQISTALIGLVLIILAVGLINIINTMDINIIVRKREFGMLRALGMTKKEMMEVLLKEASLYGIASSVIGIILGYLLIGVVYGMLKNQFVSMTFYINIAVIISTMAAAILLSMLSTILPLKRATKEDIVESIQAVE